MNICLLLWLLKYKMALIELSVFVQFAHIEIKAIFNNSS